MRQLARFLAVGVGNTAVSFVVYRLLLALGLWYVVAAPLAFAAGAVNGYILNRRWTSAVRDSTRAVAGAGVGAPDSAPRALRANRPEIAARRGAR